MAAEEDKKFDAVLGGFLVHNLHARAEHLHCPESDVLAAYHERSLLPEEMNSWKEHIAGCARCQAVLAELEATDSIPLQVPEKEEAVLAAATPHVAEKASAQMRTPVSFPEKSRSPRLSRGLRWRWLAPAGALAAGLLVWVAWHENQPPQVKPPAEVTVARREQPAAPQPSTVPQAPATTSSGQSRSDQLASLPKDKTVVGGAVSAKGTAEPKTFQQLEKPIAHARSIPAEPLLHQQAGAREAGRDVLSANPAQNQPSQQARVGLAGAVTQNLEVQAPAANAQLQNQQAEQKELNAQKASGPRALAQAQPAKKLKSESRAPAYSAAATPAPPPPAPSAAFSDVSAPAYIIAGGSNLNLIATSSRKILWRVGHAGLIDFSNDGGTSWSRQTSNVIVDLTSGSAPSDKVCWIVGRAGTILVTTDAGSQWTIVHSPLDEDLGGVRATDALHATIWNLGNIKVFETTDGGRTWKPSASP